VRGETRDGQVLANLMMDIMQGRRVRVGDTTRRPTLTERMQACTFLADRAFGKPLSMLEMMALDAVEGHRR
jgi:hypothetical protein